MAVAGINGRRLSYAEHGAGQLLVLVMGVGSPGRVWQLHQVPAFVRAGYRVVTLDNRGVDPAYDGTGFTVDDLAADVAGLIEHLGGGPAVIVGTSLGARIVQEVALSRPDLVSAMVAMAGFGRPEPVQDTLTEGEIALHDAGIVLPPAYHAAVTALQNLSPRTLGDPVATQDWLDVFAMSGSAITAGVRRQHALQLDGFTNRLADYRRIAVPSLIIAFADDQMIPPPLSREVAAAIPGAQFAEIADCGHFGYLERPDAVNETVLRFLAGLAGAANVNGGPRGVREPRS